MIFDSEVVTSSQYVDCTDILKGINTMTMMYNGEVQRRRIDYNAYVTFNHDCSKYAGLRHSPSKVSRCRRKESLRLKLFRQPPTIIFPPK